MSHNPLVNNLATVRSEEAAVRRELAGIQRTINGVLNQSNFGRILVKRLEEAEAKKITAKKASEEAKAMVKEAAEEFAWNLLDQDKKWNGRIYDPAVNITRKKRLVIHDIVGAVAWIKAAGKEEIIDIPLHGNTAVFASSPGNIVKLPDAISIELVPLAKIDGQIK